MTTMLLDWVKRIDPYTAGVVVDAALALLSAALIVDVFDFVFF